MSTDRDVTTRIVRSWLHEDAHEDADRILNLVLDEIDTTPQGRPSWLARRSPFTSNTVRIAVAAVAVVLVVFIGYQFLFGPGVGGPSPTSTSTPTVAPTVASTPVGLPEGEIPAGRYLLSSASVHYSYAISSELWQSSQPRYDGFIETRAAFPGPDFAWITPLIRLDVVAVDPCAGTETPVTSMDDAATALTQIAGTNAAAPTDLTVDGVAGKLVVLTIDGDFACDETSFWLYGDGSFYPSDKASVIRDWVFDVDGQTYLFHTDQIGSDAVLAEEIEQIIGSIRFE